jgi:hypothetical protein
MKFLVVLLLTPTYLSSAAQKEIKLEELNDHIGDSIQVRGKVYARCCYYFPRLNPCFLRCAEWTNQSFKS